MIGEVICNGMGEMPGHEGEESYDEDFINFAEKHPEYETEDELNNAYDKYMEDNK